MSYIFVKLFGGLGNQLFQYAAGYLQRKKTNGKLCFIKAINNHHDVTDYRIILGLDKYDTALPEHIVTLDLKGSAFTTWNPKDYMGAVLMDGYFQNYTMLEPILPEFKQVLLDSLKSQREIMRLKYNIESPAGFIHIRRGDYTKLSDMHHVQGLDYYTNALQQSPDLNWYIFSDDLDWVMQQKVFTDLDPVFVDESDPIMSLALMCEIHDGAIIANSTFSWWGAYLGCGISSVIYPLRWYNNTTPDLFPEQWVGF